MDIKHVLGNWSVEKHGKGLGLYAGRDAQHHGFRLLNLEDGDQNFEATVKLITAAPDLLAACQAVLDDVGDLDTYPPNASGRSVDAFHMIMAALDKAGVKPR